LIGVEAEQLIAQPFLWCMGFEKKKQIAVSI
jgi:hypothetical protein